MNAKNVFIGICMILALVLSACNSPTGSETSSNTSETGQGDTTGNGPNNTELISRTYSGTSNNET